MNRPRLNIERERKATDWAANASEEELVTTLNKTKGTTYYLAAKNELESRNRYR